MSAELREKLAEYHEQLNKQRYRGLVMLLLRHNPRKIRQ